MLLSGEIIGGKVGEWMQSQQDAITENLKLTFYQWATGIFHFIVGISFYATLYICEFCIIYYIATKSPKFNKIIWGTFITYILLKGVDSQL